MSEVMKAMIVTAMGIVTLIFTIQILGTVVDGFFANFLAVTGSGISDSFMPGFNIIPKFISFFYFIPLIFVVLMFTWIFKLIFLRHRYSYEEDEW